MSDDINAKLERFLAVMPEVLELSVSLAAMFEERANKTTPVVQVARERRVLDAIVAAPGDEFEPKKLVVMLGISESAAWSACSRLHRTNRIRQIRHGVYAAIPPT